MSYRTASSSEGSEDISMPSQNLWCVFLHIAEGIGLQRKRNGNELQHDQITMHASLNTTKFEIDGHSTETVTIFNSNCVWECSLSDLKRMRTENRPVRIACFLNNGVKNSPPLKLIGTLLLPIRGLSTLSTINNYQPKMLWHKLGALCTEWRPYKPELCLFIVIAKKSLVNDNSLNDLMSKKPQNIRSPRNSETASMLQSQSNVYVQLLEQLGLIQVGNNPDVDCDIFLVRLSLKRVKNLAKLLEIESWSKAHGNFVFQYEIFGSATLDEITTDASDSYALNQKVSLKFKASVQSLLLYFQRIFYIPIVIYYNGHAVASYRFDCSKYFPNTSYFNTNKVWNKNGTFLFDRFHKILSPRAPKPSVEFTFSLQLLESFSTFNKEIVPLRETFVPYKVDEGAAGDGKNGYQTARSSNSKCSLLCDKQYSRAKSEPMMAYSLGGALSESHRDSAVEMSSVCTDTEDLQSCTEYVDVCISTDAPASPKTVGINTEPIPDTVPTESSNDAEALTIKMVKELEAWKAQQMDEFLEKLERKEVIYLANLEKDWLKQQSGLQQCLDSKNNECEQLKRQLELIKKEVETRRLEDAITAKREAERVYAQKIKILEMDIQHMRTDLEQQKRCSAAEKLALEAQQQEKAKLQQENQALKQDIAQLEQKLVSLGKTHFSAEQLKEMMTDLRQQTERFADVEKQRNFYKDKLSKATREVQQLKLSMLKQQELSLLKSSKDELDINFIDIQHDEVDEEEQVTLNAVFKHKHTESKMESKDIKEMILLHTEASTSNEDSESCKTDF